MLEQPHNEINNSNNPHNHKIADAIKATIGERSMHPDAWNNFRKGLKYGSTSLPSSPPMKLSRALGNQDKIK